LVNAEMSATADTMQEDRPADADAVRAALDWIESQVSRIERQREKRAA
jgi:hypothetical protein